MIEHISWYLIFFFFLLGGAISVLYYRFLWYTLKKMDSHQRKGLFLFYTSIVRLALFILLTFLITGFKPEKFIWYILGFIVVRFVIVYQAKKEKKKK